MTEEISKLASLDEDQLISLVRSRSWLYDRKHSDFKNESAKQKAWRYIGDTLRCSAADCMAKWMGLRQRFVREKEKEVERELRLGGSSNGIKSSWNFMNAMRFMEPHVTLRIPSTFVIPTSTQEMPRSVLMSGKTSPSGSNTSLHRRPETPPPSPSPAILSAAPLSVPTSTTHKTSLPSSYNVDRSERSESIEVPLIPPSPVPSAKFTSNRSISFDLPISPRSPHQESTNDPGLQRRSNLDNQDLSSLLTSMSTLIQHVAQNNRKKNEENAEEIFGRLVGAELAKFQDEDLINQAKMKILQVIFKMRMGESVPLQ